MDIRRPGWNKPQAGFAGEKVQQPAGNLVGQLGLAANVDRVAQGDLQTAGPQPHPALRTARVDPDIKQPFHSQKLGLGVVAVAREDRLDNFEQALFDHAEIAVRRQGEMQLAPDHQAVGGMIEEFFAKHAGVGYHHQAAGGTGLKCVAAQFEQGQFEQPDFHHLAAHTLHFDPVAVLDAEPPAQPEVTGD